MDDTIPPVSSNSNGGLVEIYQRSSKQRNTKSTYNSTVQANDKATPESDVYVKLPALPTSNHITNPVQQTDDKLDTNNQTTNTEEMNVQNKPNEKNLEQPLATDKDSELFIRVNKQEMLRRMAFEDEISCLRREIAKISRENALARLSKPRTVTKKHVDRIKCESDVFRRSNVSKASERIKQLAAPRK